MNKDYNIRMIKVEDFPTLTKWWEHYEGVEVPDSGLLPNGGLGGLVAEREGKLILAAFIYMTNSDIGYVDYMVSYPQYKNKDTHEMIFDLLDTCSEIAVRQGCRIIWSMTSYEGMRDLCKKKQEAGLDYELLKDPYWVMYSHKKAYKKLKDKNEI